MIYSIDRFEGDTAVIISEDNGNKQDIERALLPAEAGEGAIIREENGTYTYDAEATAARRKSLFQRTNKLSKK